MTKNMEYKEPEFKLVITSSEDILTASDNSLDPTDSNWEMPETTIGF